MRLVVFDIDGTLVDSQDTIVAAQTEAFASQGLTPPSRERALGVVGLSLPEAFTALVGPQGPVLALAEAYKQAFRRLVDDPKHRDPLFPGMGDLVADLAARPGLRLGLATGKSRRGVARLERQQGWSRLFATIQTADDAPSKPDPTMLHRAMAETGATPHDTVMIGDTTFDIAMAQTAGIHAVAVAWGYHRPDALAQAGAEVVVKSARELRSHLMQLGF
ncbi:MAG TPA: HAD-IA family hydrolase [Beijerinckiaceae bacterium]